MENTAATAQAGVKKIPVCMPYFWGEEKEYAMQALETGWISSSGRFITQFEKEFSKVIGVEHSVAVTNGTAAIYLALDVLKIAPGDEVILPAFCMIAPLLAILNRGAVPVLVDADHTWNLDPAQIEQKINPRTKAILVVHTYGLPADMDAILDIAKRHNLYVIEDAAEALGATYKGRQAGSFGDVASFSFYANKTITCGEGGMVVTNNRQLYERALSMRNLCFGADGESRYIHEDVGHNYRMSNVHAALGLGQLKHLDEALEAKINIANTYRSLLDGITGLVLPPESAQAVNIYWVFGILITPEFGLSRKQLQDKLAEHGIDTRRFFYPVNKQPIYPAKSYPEYYPATEMLAECGLYLPSYVGMETESIEYVAEIIKKYKA